MRNWREDEKREEKKKAEEMREVGEEKNITWVVERGMIGAKDDDKL